MILEIRDVSKVYAVEKGMLRSAAGSVRALDRVSVRVREFSTMGIVGESGSGKTTLAKIIMGLVEQSSGEVVFNPAFIRTFHKDAQIIFQNPFNSLNPKMRVVDLVGEPLVIHKLARGRRQIEERVAGLLETVELPADILSRYPHEFSGGQRQRICIARALACEPKFLVLDEPISSLDLTIQARMLDLFLDLKQRYKLTYVFISHNLAVVKHIADDLVVLHQGRVVEQGVAQDIFARPAADYTRLLLAAA